MILPKESGIYKIQNKINSKCYIGQSIDINRRVNTHICLLRNSHHYNPHLQRAWDKYGEDAFDISVVELCDKQDLNDKEIFYISKYDSFKHGYNDNEGGGGINGYVFSEESKQKMRDSHYDCSGVNNPRSRSVVLLNTGEFFDCITFASNEYGICKGDISKNAKYKSYFAGHCNDERLVWRYIDDYLQMTSDDILNTLSLAQACTAGERANKAKKVICINDGSVFGSIHEAAECYEVSPPTISKACRIYKDTDGVSPCSGVIPRWAFYEDYIQRNTNADFCDAYDYNAIAI